LEIAIIQIKCEGSKINIITLYRAPTGTFDYFLNKLDHILSKYNTDYIICGDINVNNLENNSKKVQLDDMLRMNNLKSTVYFPTRIAKNSATLIDNIFINGSRNYNLKQC
jgi:exonuclease III